MSSNDAEQSAAADARIRDTTDNEHAFISTPAKFMLTAEEVRVEFGADAGTPKVIVHAFEWGDEDAQVSLGMPDVAGLHQFLGGVIGRTNGVPESDITALGELHSIIAGIEDPKLHDQLIAVHNRFRTEAGL